MWWIGTFPPKFGVNLLHKFQENWIYRWTTDRPTADAHAIRVAVLCILCISKKQELKTKRPMGLVALLVVLNHLPFHK